MREQTVRVVMPAARSHRKEGDVMNDLDGYHYE